MFGHYACKNCGNTWKSSHSWEDYGQKCLRCNHYVKPLLLLPKQPKLDYAYSCANCGSEHTTCKTEDINEQSVFRKRYAVDCKKCGQKHDKLNVDVIRITNPICALYIGKCKKCFEEIIIEPKIISSASIITTCKECKNNMSFLKSIRKIKSDLSKPHRQDMCEKCIKDGKYCGR